LRHEVKRLVRPWQPRGVAGDKLQPGIALRGARDPLLHQVDTGRVRGAVLEKAVQEVAGTAADLEHAAARRVHACGAKLLKQRPLQFVQLKSVSRVEPRGGLGLRGGIALAVCGTDALYLWGAVLHMRIQHRVGKGLRYRQQPWSHQSPDLSARPGGTSAPAPRCR
jgi:hypothetical protein